MGLACFRRKKYRLALKAINSEDGQVWLLLGWFT
jgi:hypothetical protein